MSLPKLPEGWEILYAAYLYGDRVRGGTRLNKTLSEFQKEGLPVKEKFEIREYGPYSEEVRRKAEKLNGEGLLKVDKEELSGKYDERTDYSTTARGDAKVKNEIFPLLDKHPIPDQFLKSALEVVKKFRKMNNEQIVEEVHDDLYIDDQDEYYEEMVRVNKTLSSYLDEHDEAFEEFHFCDALVQALGAIELCHNATKEIIPQFVTSGGRVMSAPEMAGNNHILVIGQGLLDLVQNELEGHLESHGDEGSQECAELAEDFRLLMLNAEQNSKLYGIYAPTLEA